VWQKAMDLADVVYDGGYPKFRVWGIA